VMTVGVYDFNGHRQRSSPRNGSGDLFGVKAASSLYLVPARQVLYVVTWTHGSGCASWCWRLLEGMFPPCSFSGQVSNSVSLLFRQSRWSVAGPSSCRLPTPQASVRSSPDQRQARRIPRCLLTWRIRSTQSGWSWLVWAYGDCEVRVTCESK
jgi:hypothetical protein